jgi:hypothetical protein
LDLIGLANSVYEAASHIDTGRKGFAIRGKEQEGRISYEYGIDKYRVNGFPKDSFHIACIAHKTRIQNILRAPGLDLLEKELLKQRYANLFAAQNGYVERQAITLIC